MIGVDQQERRPCAAASSRKSAQQGSLMMSATTTGFAPIGGRAAARADIRPDAHAVDRFTIGLGQARRGAMAQAQAVLVEQQDRAEHAGELRFDEAHEAIEHLRERRARRDHFEDLRLAVAQRLRHFARGDVARNADEADDFAAVVPERHLCRGNPDLFRRSGR